jgi:hypothetical protein
MGRSKWGAWCAAGATVLALAGGASAQGRHQRPPPPPKQDEPKPGASDDDEDHAPLLRTEPEIAPPADPLLISPEARERIGTDWDSRPPSPEGSSSTQWFPYYERREGESRLRLLPPFLVEHTRGLPDPTQRLYGVPKTEDTEGLYGLLYYRRRSQQLDMDLVFPAFWRVRDGDNHVVVAGPVMHREAPGQNDNWVAPLFFEGERKDGGYFHAPLLLTTSHWNTQGAFTLVGTLRTYTLIPPLLFYHSEHELDSSMTTVAGPVIVQSDPKRSVFDIAPLFFHSEGKPESGGVRESHTTFFPLFHYGYDPNSSLFVVPGYYRHVTPTTDTLLSPFYSQSVTRSGGTTLTAAGPIVPLWWNYRDRDLGIHAWAIAPFYYSSDSPAGHDWLTPLVGRFETYGQSRTWWVFPTLTLMSDRHGWEDDFHPLIYVGRSDDASHTVVAPVFWDFANPRGRTTIGFPLYWRFADTTDDSVIQVAANTVYVQKRVAGGTDWEFHLVPLFSYGEHPDGYFWNVLFGLAGYSRDGTSSQVRALWLPINFGTPHSSIASQ